MAGDFLPPVITRLTGDIDDLAAKIAEAKALIGSLDGKTIRIEVSTRGIAGAVTGAVAQINALKAAMAGLDNKNIKIGVDGLGGAMAGAATARAAMGGFRLFGFGINAQVLHWLIAGFAELAAVVIPATVAIAGWGAVWLEASANAVDHMKALYGATEATANMFHTTTGDVLGMGHALQAAQTAAHPQVYEALGAGLRVVEETSGNVVKAGTQLGKVFDNFGAKLVSDFRAGGTMAAGMNHLLGNMVGDATGLGQVFGNLGHVLLSLADQMPGLAEALLAGLAGFLHIAAAAIDAAGRFRVFGLSIITVAMAFEEFNRWGGLAISLIARTGITSYTAAGGFFSFARAASVIKGVFMILPGIIGNVGLGLSLMSTRLAGAGSAMVGFGSKIANVIEDLGTGWTIAIFVAVAALGFLIYKLATATSSTQRFTASLQKMADKASNVNVLNVLASNLGTLTKQYSAASKAAITAADAAGTTGGKFQQMSAEASAAIQRQAQLASALQNTRQQFIAVSTHAAALAAQYHTSFLGALILADNAGVKLNQTYKQQAWALGQIKIANLVQGYKAMGAPLSTVGKDMNMLAIQAGLAGTKVAQLNQAADQFMQNLTGGTAAFAAFETSLVNIGQVAGSTAKNLGTSTATMSLNTGQFAKALTSFNATGSSAWTNFDQVVGSTAPQIFDWFRTAGAEGALSGAQMKQGVEGVLSQLIPFAAKSKIAQTSLLGLAQSGGMTAKTFPDLVRQIRDAHVSAGEMARIFGNATAKMGDMAGVAAQLGTVLQSDLINALGASAIKASGVSAAMVGYMKAVENGTAATKAGEGARQAVIRDMEKLGISASTANKMLDAVANRVSSMPSHHTITIAVNLVGNGAGLVSSGGNASINTGAGGIKHIKLAAAGTASALPSWYWVGEQGPELVHMGGGEQILPHSASMRRAASSGGGDGVIVHVDSHLHLDGQELFGAVKEQTYSYNIANGNRNTRGRVKGVMVPR